MDEDIIGAGRAARVRRVALLLGLALAAGGTPPALAQQVPALARHPAAAVPSDASGAAGAVVPAGLDGLPPPIDPISRSNAPLDRKAARGLGLANEWKGARTLPGRGGNGAVTYAFGATLPSLVCAPLHVCFVQLQPGEVVNLIDLGDKVRWLLTRSVAGDGSSGGEAPTIGFKPTDSGLETNGTILTDRRVYSIKLLSRRNDWMPLITFSYPDDAAAQDAAYQRMLAQRGSTLSTGQHVEALDFGFAVSGDHPVWRPLRVYSDGLKTYIQFPPEIRADEAPALVALGDDGGWFSDPSEQLVNYRMAGDRYVVDKVLRRAALISGVGDGQTRVEITRDERVR